MLVQIHADHIAAGARVIATNTFPTARHVLEQAGLGKETASLNRAAVALAHRAAEEAGVPEILVAGSMSSMAALGDWRRAPVGAHVAAAYREQAELQAEAGVGLLIAEMMLDPENAALVIEAAQQTALPLLVGWSASPDGSGGVATYRTEQIRPPDSLSFHELMREGTQLGGDVHGIMHSPIEVTGSALRVLGEHWDGPTMPYAETGPFEPPDWVFPTEALPRSYAAAARRWVGDGVQIVGGCCGTTPEHISAIVGALTDGEGSGAS